MKTHQSEDKTRGLFRKLVLRNLSAVILAVSALPARAFLDGGMEGDYLFVDLYDTGGGVFQTAPIADASATPLIVISRNAVDAAVTLDGSRSFDADGDTLIYVWFLDEFATYLGRGVRLPVTLPIGTHSLNLVVIDDVFYDDVATVNVDIITASIAVRRLIDTLNTSTLLPREKQPLIATLRTAAASFDSGNSTAAWNQLGAFQKKLHAQISNAELAGSLSNMAQNIIDSLRP